MTPPNTIQPSRIYRGTIDEVLSHRHEIPAGATVELKVYEVTLETKEQSNAFADKSLADVLQEIGTVKGLPADLSANPEYMKGFGKMRKPRISEE